MAKRQRKDRSGAQGDERAKGFGEDQGTRVGRPDEPARRKGASLEAETPTSRAPDQTSAIGAGSEAAEGLHAVGGRDPSKRSSVESMAERGDDTEDLPGSEPIEGRSHEHKGGYGGEGGEPRQ